MIRCNIQHEQKQTICTITMGFNCGICRNGMKSAKTAWKQVWIVIYSYYKDVKNGGRIEWI